MAGVKINRLSKRFGDLTMLKNISLSIKNGEFLTLLGPSGCGKTTLLRLIAGLEDISDGQIHIDENCVNDVRPKDRNIAMVFQSYALYPHLNIFGNIAMPLMMRRLKPYERWPIVGKLSYQSRQTHKEIRASVIQVAKMLDIEHLLDRKPSQISGGQRQRVALGRAMVRNPSVFLMDEPLSNLDAKLRVHMRTEIAELHRKLRSTFVYVTHDQAEAMTMSDRIALMIDGQLLQIAPPKEIYRNPNHLKVAEFIGTPKINLVPGTVRDDGQIESCGMMIKTNIAAKKNQPLQIGVRPEAVRIIDADQPGWKGKVVHLEHLGAYFLVHVRIDTVERPIISRIGATRMAEPTLGMDVRLGAGVKNLLFFDHAGNRLQRAA